MAGRPEKYAYDRLFDGRAHKLLGAGLQQVQTIRLAARRRGLPVEQRKIPGGYEVIVHPGNGTRAPARPARPVRL